MTLLATINGDQRSVWLVALGLGLVVVLVVIVLLSMLRSLVRTIDTGVDELWTVTKRFAQNTTGMYQLAGTGSILRALREEMLRQDVLLSSHESDGMGANR